MYRRIEVSTRVWYYGPLMRCSSINRITPRRVSAPRRFNTMLLLSFLFVRFWIVRQFRFSFFLIPIPIMWNILIYRCIVSVVVIIIIRYCKYISSRFSITPSVYFLVRLSDIVAGVTKLKTTVITRIYVYYTNKKKSIIYILYQPLAAAV